MILLSYAQLHEPVVIISEAIKLYELASVPPNAAVTPTSAISSAKAGGFKSEYLLS